MVRKIYETEFLIKPSMGIGLRRTWWSDGSITEIEFQMAAPVIPVRIY